MKNSARTVAFCGVSAALLFVLLLIETFVFSALPVAPPAILAIPFAIALSSFGDRRFLFLGGTALGICSLVCALMIGNVYFINPLISVLPRVLMGLIAGLVADLLKRVCEKSNKKFIREILPYSVAGFVGVLLNTAFVLAAVFLFFGGDVMKTFFAAVITFNTLFEIAGGMVLTPIYCNVLNKVLKI